jgi:hypothetical protein
MLELNFVSPNEPQTGQAKRFVAFDKVNRANSLKIKRDMFVWLRPLILGEEQNDNAEYLDVCRGKRSTVEYDAAGAVTRDEARELISFAKEMRHGVVDWLKKNHPNLC